MEDNNERIEKLLALLLIENMRGTQKDKAYKLSLSGFTNSEIADLLDTTPQVIATHLYESRKTKKKPKKKKP